MSTRDDASLTARERAALARLEATAAAEDPQLASRLRGSSRLRLLTRVPAVPGWVRSRWWGVPALVLGLVLVVLSVSLGLAVGIIGAALCVAGLWLVVGMVERRWMRGRTSEK
jgi:hypothetical protein